MTPETTMHVEWAEYILENGGETLWLTRARRSSSSISYDLDDNNDELLYVQTFCTADQL